MTAEEILSLSLTEVAKKIKSKELSSQEVVSACLKKIGNSKTNAVICVSESALDEAKQKDLLLSEGKAQGRLFGVPVLLKANMCTADKMPTSCCSKYLKDFYAPYEATVVTRLKQEGAIILGKTNMDEFAMGSSNENSAFGKVLNPLDNERVPGGSSGGSAAAVAEKLCFAALGTDTGGSIRQPASLCGVVGLKPTYGSVSRRGIVAFASSLDQVGPIARTTEDVALLYSVIMGTDINDSTTNREKEGFYLCTTSDVKGLKIGIAKEIFELMMRSDVKENIDNAIKFYKDHGAEIVDVSLPSISKALSVYYILSSAEAASNLSRYDGIRYGKRETGKDLIDTYYKSRTKGLGAEVKRRIMLGNYVLSSGFYDAYYKKATDVQTIIKQEFSESFKKCDVLLSPASPQVAWRFGEKASPLENYLADIFTVPVNIAGLPAISFPCGKGEGNMPVGLQLIAAPNNEKTLFTFASFFERNGGAK